MSHPPQEKDLLFSSIWREEAEADDPFSAKTCFCHGYDVYGDLLGKASWSEYLYLLFRGDRPTDSQSRLIANLAVSLAHPGPRDPSIRAAMNAGVGGSSSASCLMAALAVGAGNLAGGREIYQAVTAWQQLGTEMDLWRSFLLKPATQGRVDVWEPMEHPPGFAAYGIRCAEPVIQMLHHVEIWSDGPALPWLRANRLTLETIAERPLAISGVAAAAFYDLGFNQDQAELAYLLLRLPGAAVHALEQRRDGWRKYPYFHDKLELTDDPGKSAEKQEVTGR
ncbi:MAG: citryl-CoA lyase [Planctomycetota bacterium]|nr:MAG: citryl-CoA lyase [Planctomycetota bacterium]